MPPNPWIKWLSPNPAAALRLFCFPFSGGSAFSFRAWSNALPDTIELCAIELPGRGSRLTEPLFTQMSPLIEAMGAAVLPHLEKPFAFFGHSLGGIVSFELVRWLRRSEYPLPAQLLVSGHRAPQMPLRRRLVHTLPDREFVDHLRRLNGTPDAVLQNAELMELLLPALRADFTIFETYGYQPEAPLECPITAYGGQQDAEVNAAELAEWHQQTIADFSVRSFPGGHFFIYSAQSQILDSLCARLLGDQ